MISIIKEVNYDGVNPVSPESNSQVSAKSLGEYPKDFMKRLVGNIRNRKDKNIIVNNTSAPQTTEMTTSSVGDLNQS